MPPKRPLLVSLLASTLALGACGDKKKPRRVDEASGSSEARAEDGGFRSAAGRYSVAFPFGAPKESTKLDPKGVTWNEAKSEVGAYSVLWADYPDAKAAQASVDDYIRVMKAEITEDNETTVDGHKAREIKMKVSETATMWMRILTDDKRVYKVGAGTKNDKVKALKFIDTFRLTK